MTSKENKIINERIFEDNILKLLLVCFPALVILGILFFIIPNLIIRIITSYICISFTLTTLFFCVYLKKEEKRQRVKIEMLKTHSFSKEQTITITQTEDNNSIKIVFFRYCYQTFLNSGKYSCLSDDVFREVKSILRSSFFKDNIQKLVLDIDSNKIDRKKLEKYYFTENGLVYYFI